MDEGFSREARADFQKNFKNCRLFLSRPNWFSELSQIPISKLAKAKKRVFVLSLESLDQKLRFSWSAAPFEICIYWP